MFERSKIAERFVAHAQTHAVKGGACTWGF
jgi:hypothetical protein